MTQNMKYNNENNLDGVTFTSPINYHASKEKKFRIMLKAFKITDLVRNFNGGSTTNKLNTIKIIIQQQKGSTPEIVEGSTDSYTEYTYELDYSKVANL